MVYSKEWSKNYYQKNKDKRLTYIKDRYKSNSEYREACLLRSSIQDQGDYMREYYKENKEYFSNYSINRYHSNPQYRIAQQMRNRFNEILKKQNIKKNNSIIKYLGCSLEEYKFHISSQFEKEMNWGNQGEIWELDHQIPCSSFDFSKEDEIYKCFNYTNIKPLFKNNLIAKKFGYENYEGNRNKLNKIKI